VHGHPGDGTDGRDTDIKRMGDTAPGNAADSCRDYGVGRQTSRSGAVTK